VGAWVELGFGMPHEQWHSQVSRGILAQYIDGCYPHMKGKTNHRRFPVSDLQIPYCTIVSSPDTTTLPLPLYQPRIQLFYHHHVFTRNSIRLRPQPSRWTDAPNPHRGHRSRGPNLYCPTTHCEPNALFEIRPRLIPITERRERRRHRRVISSYQGDARRRRNDGKPCTGLQSSKAEPAADDVIAK
jgi:hypothetical protein